MIVIIDTGCANLSSVKFAIERLGYNVTVSADPVILQQADKLFLPGVGTASEAMKNLIDRDLIEPIKSLTQPVLGICLGHQAIVEHFGGTISRAEAVMHGKSSDITHCGDKMFSGFAQPLPVARYHSLMASSVPACLSVLAQVNDIPMAVYHEAHNMLGFQFHPESILTHQGSQLLAQSIEFLVAQSLLTQ